MAQSLGRGFHELPCRSMMMVFKESLWLCGSIYLWLNFNFFFKLSVVCIFWIVLMYWYQKWFLKNKKHHWHVFRHKKLFEKQPLPHCQTPSKFLDPNKDLSWFIFNLLTLSVEFKIYLILNKVIFYFEKNTCFFICIFQICS